MTELRKICPNSGEKCDCPKGVCNKSTYLLAGDALTDALDDVYFETDALQAHANEAKDENVASENEQSRIDQQEASSLKYALCAQILSLSSGKFALFGPYSMQDGIPLLTIDTWENLEPHVRAYRKAAEEGHEREKLAEEQRRKITDIKAAADYDSLFGDK